MSTHDLGQLYAAARHRIIDLIMSAPSGCGEAPCPATPEWSVHDVVAHLRGICEDVRTGNMEGVTTDPWTAAQVARHRHTSVADLLDGWIQDAPLLEGFLSSPDGASSFRAVFDVATHEADLRGALRRSVPLNSELAAFVIPLLAQSFVDAAAEAGLPAVRVETDQGDVIGAADAAVVLRISQLEFFRCRFGRRSRNQALRYDWGSADAGPYVDRIFVFGPRESDLVELLSERG